MSCFRRITDADIQLILRYANHTTYRRQKALYYQSEPAGNVFLLLSGKVIRLKYRADESCVVLGQAEKADWVGLAEILLRSPYLTDAIAETQTEALVFSAKVFDEVMKISGMKEFFLEYLAKSLFILHSQIELNLPLPRLIQYVLAHSQVNEDGSSFLAATQDEIARAIGVTRETVNKYLQTLQNEGLLRIGRGYIQILNSEALDEKII